MGMGQMLSVLGALMLLSMVSLGINTMLVSKTTVMLEAEASLSAISLAQTSCHLLWEVPMRAPQPR